MLPSELADQYRTLNPFSAFHASLENGDVLEWFVLILALLYALNYRLAIVSARKRGFDFAELAVPALARHFSRAERVQETRGSELSLVYATGRKHVRFATLSLVGTNQHDLFSRVFLDVVTGRAEETCVLEVEYDVAPEFTWCAYNDLGFLSTDGDNNDEVSNKKSGRDALPDFKFYPNEASPTDARILTSRLVGALAKSRNLLYSLVISPLLKGGALKQGGLRLVAYPPKSAKEKEVFVELIGAMLSIRLDEQR